MVVIHYMLLRVIRRTSCPSIASLQIIGVDDFAMHKPQSYGTNVIDLERRQSVALLPTSHAATLSQWLATHSGLQVTTCHRSKAYDKVCLICFGNSCAGFRKG
jgi:hypothetical protein